MDLSFDLGRNSQLLQIVAARVSTLATVDRIFLPNILLPQTAQSIISTDSYIITITLPAHKGTTLTSLSATYSNKRSYLLVSDALHIILSLVTIFVSLDRQGILPLAVSPSQVYIENTGKITFSTIPSVLDAGAIDMITSSQRHMWQQLDEMIAEIVSFSQPLKQWMTAHCPAILSTMVPLSAKLHYYLCLNAQWQLYLSESAGGTDSQALRLLKADTNSILRNNEYFGAQFLTRICESLRTMTGDLVRGLVSDQMALLIGTLFTQPSDVLDSMVARTRERPTAAPELRLPQLKSQSCLLVYRKASSCGSCTEMYVTKPGDVAALETLLSDIQNFCTPENLYRKLLERLKKEHNISVVRCASPEALLAALRGKLRALGIEDRGSDGVSLSDTLGLCDNIVYMLCKIYSVSKRFIGFSLDNCEHMSQELCRLAVSLRSVLPPFAFFLGYITYAQGKARHEARSDERSVSAETSHGVAAGDQAVLSQQSQSPGASLPSDSTKAQVQAQAQAVAGPLVCRISDYDKYSSLERLLSSRAPAVPNAESLASIFQSSHTVSLYVGCAGALSSTVAFIQQVGDEAPEVTSFVAAAKAVSCGDVRCVVTLLIRLIWASSLYSSKELSFFPSAGYMRSQCPCSAVVKRTIAQLNTLPEHVPRRSLFWTVFLWHPQPCPTLQAADIVRLSVSEAQVALKWLVRHRLLGTCDADAYTLASETVNLLARQSLGLVGVRPRVHTFLRRQRADSPASSFHRDLAQTLTHSIRYDDLLFVFRYYTDFVLQKGGAQVDGVAPHDIWRVVVSSWIAQSADTLLPGAELRAEDAAARLSARDSAPLAGPAQASPSDDTHDTERTRTTVHDDDSEAPFGLPARRGSFAGASVFSSSFPNSSAISVSSLGCPSLGSFLDNAAGIPQYLQDAIATYRTNLLLNLRLIDVLAPLLSPASDRLQQIFVALKLAAKFFKALLKVYWGLSAQLSKDSPDVLGLAEDLLNYQSSISYKMYLFMSPDFLARELAPASQASSSDTLLSSAKSQSFLGSLLSQNSFTMCLVARKLLNARHPMLSLQIALSIIGSYLDLPRVLSTFYPSYLDHVFDRRYPVAHSLCGFMQDCSFFLTLEAEGGGGGGAGSGSGGKGLFTQLFLDIASFSELVEDISGYEQTNTMRERYRECVNVLMSSFEVALAAAVVCSNSFVFHACVAITGFLVQFYAHVLNRYADYIQPFLGLASVLATGPVYTSQAYDIRDTVLADLTLPRTRAARAVEVELRSLVELPLIASRVGRVVLSRYGRFCAPRVCADVVQARVLAGSAVLLNYPTLTSLLALFVLARDFLAGRGADGVLAMCNRAIRLATDARTAKLFLLLRDLFGVADRAPRGFFVRVAIRAATARSLRSAVDEFLAMGCNYYAVVLCILLADLFALRLGDAPRALHYAQLAFKHCSLCSPTDISGVHGHAVFAYLMLSAHCSGPRTHNTVLGLLAGLLRDPYAMSFLSAGQLEALRATQRKIAGAAYAIRTLTDDPVCAQYWALVCDALHPAPAPAHRLRDRHVRHRRDTLELGFDYFYVITRSK